MTTGFYKVTYIVVLRKFSSEIEKSLLGYHSIILTEIVIEAANCSCKYLFWRYKQKTAWKSSNLIPC